MTRLHDTYPELAQQIGDLDLERKSQAVLHAATKALELSGIKDPLIAKALDIIRQGDEDAADSIEFELDRFATDLEQPYLDAQKRGVDLLDDKIDVGLFTQARAIDALRHFLREDFDDSLYEALNAGVPIELVERSL
jgi:hypothetical protein